MSAPLGSIHRQADYPEPSWAELCDRASEALEAARARSLTLGTAESCTGGLACAALTSVAGSSDVVMGSVASYACSVKEAVLGVEHEVIASVGAVSEECARQMAEGAARVLGSSIAVSMTGIAGPGGAVPGKPVGTVWLACSDGRSTHAERHVFSGDRAAVRAKTVLCALSLVVDFMEGGLDVS